MRAKVKLDRKAKKWNVLGEYEGEWLKLGKSKGPFVDFLEFDTKEAAEEFIKNKDGLELINT